MSMLNNDPRFQINPNLNLEHLGTLVNEALFTFGEHPDTCRDILFELNAMIFPNATTVKESVAVAEPPLFGSNNELDLCDIVVGLKRDPVTGEIKTHILKAR